MKNSETEWHDKGNKKILLTRMRSKRLKNFSSATNYAENMVFKP